MIVETLVVMIARTPGLQLEQEDCEVDNENIARFSAPLMLNVLLWWATPLIINAVLARTANPDTALAAFAVVEAVAWFIAAPVGQLQHASIALVKCSETHRRVCTWGAVVAFAMLGLLLLISIPSLREPLLGYLFALEADLIAVAGPALPIAAAYPLLYGIRQYYQGLFVRSGRPVMVGAGAVLRVTTILVAAVLVHRRRAGGRTRRLAFEGGTPAGAQDAFGVGRRRSMGLGVGLAVFGLAKSSMKKLSGSSNSFLAAK